MRRLIIGGFTIFFTLFFSSPVPGQEATAHLVFKKKKPPDSLEETREYTVKPNETLIIIASRQLGVKKERMRFIYREILPLNPGIKNVNRIFPGQKIYLPVMKADVGGKTKDSLTSPNLALIKAVVEKLGGTFSLTGQHVIPLGDTGQMSISCSHVPVADFPDGTVVMLDLMGRIKTDLKNLILKNWPNYRIVSFDPRWNSFETLAHLINAAAPSQTMIPVKQDLLLRNGLHLNVPTSWLITGSKRLLLYSATPGDERLPPLVKKLLSERGLDALEIQGEKFILPELEENEPPTESVPHLKADSAEGFVIELLKILGYQPTGLNEISIFTLDEDGFILNIPAICRLEKGGEVIVFIHRPIPVHFQQILKKRGVKAVSLTFGDRDQNIREVAQALNLPYVSGRQVFNLSPPHYRKKFSLSFPTIYLPRTPAGALHFVSFNLDEGVYAFLKQKSNLRLIRY